MKIDLHVHTKERSACAGASEDEQVQAAVIAGLDCIFITDHARLVPTERLLDLNHRYPPTRIFGGIEVTSDGEDILVLGIRDDCLERTDWAYPDLHAFVRAHGGFMVLAHPYRHHPNVGIDLEHYPTDAVEVHSPNTPPASETDIRALADHFGLFLLSNSDSHTTERLGMYYNILPGKVREESELIAALRSQQPELHKP